MNNTKVKNALTALVPPLFSIIIAMFVSVFLVLWAKNMPVHHYFTALSELMKIIFTESFSTPVKFMEVLVSATPLLFCGLAHIVCFKCGLFNIGVEGQFIMGLVSAGVIGQLRGVPFTMHIILIFLGGIVAGGLWGFIPGILKAKKGTNEVVICIMMNFMSMYLSNYVALRSGIADTANDASFLIQDASRLPRFIEKSRLNISVIVAILLAVCVYLLLFRSKRGFQIRSVGFNQYAAQSGGVNTTANITLALVIAGGIAGLGGALHVSGVQHKLVSLTSFPNYGMDAIAIALLCNKHPIACIFVAILFGSLRNCSRMFQIEGIPKDIVYVIQAVVIFFVAADLISKHLKQRRAGK